MNSSAVISGLTAVALGLLVSPLLSASISWMVRRFRPGAGTPMRQHVLVALGTSLLAGSFVAASLTYQPMAIPEVQPGVFWDKVRLGHQLVLIGLLVLASGIDFREYLIPDEITVPGTIYAVLMATATGHMQIEHVWIDWTQAIPGLQGPYIPQWIADHPHWHGLVWSLCGGIAGGGITWLVRFVASKILGQEALGFGDVTLMTMIGCFVGWQAVIFILAIAPLCGIVIGIINRILGGKPYVPYGPYLSAAAIVVLFTWRWLWMFELKSGEWSREDVFAIRNLFGDGIALAMIAGIALAALSILLGLLRLYRQFRIGRRSSSEHKGY